MSEVGEIFGYLGMAFIVFSIYTNDQLKFRIFGIVACMILAVQAVFIGSVSLLLLNCLMFGIHLTKFISLLGEKNVDITENI